MISINKQGNAIVIEFTDNDKYLFNGKIEIAPNELIVVVDDSEMATFKKASNGDVLFSQLISKIQIEGNSVTKDTILDEFAKIGFQSIDWAEITGKPTTFSDWDATEGERVIANKPDLSEYATNSELNNVKAELANKADTSSLNDYALKSEITGLATKEELDNYQPVGDYATTTQLNSKQDTLVSGTNIKTINGEPILGGGNIEIASGGEVDTEMSDTSENAVQNKVIKQYVDTASSEFNNWKNGESIVAGLNSNSTGAYAVTIGGETENKTVIGVVIGYGAKAESGWPVVIGKDCIASNTTPRNNVLISSMSTSGYDNVLIGGNTGFMSRGNNQVIINTWRGYSPGCNANDIVSINAALVATSDKQVNILATGGASDSVAIGLLSDDNTALRIGKDGKAYIYNNGTEVAIQDTINKVDTEIPELISSKANSADVYTKAEIDSKGYALKSEIPTKVSQLNNDSGYLTEIPAEYVTNTELEAKGYLTEHQDISNLATKEELATKADASALSSKLDTLVSGTNIKTINGDSILGSGNLVIQGGWDDIQGKPLFARVATSGDYNDLINKPTIPDVSGLATKEEIADMETKSNAAATYATKDEIPSLAGYLTETAASETYATKLELGNKLNTATYNSEKAGFETKENAAATYQVKGDYATKSEIPTATSQLTNDSGFITEIPSEYITETELSSSLNSKADSANVYTKAEIDNMIGLISARLDQINGEVV